MKENNIVCSFSGGRSSAFMAIWLKLRYPLKNIIFLFANTGKEKEETLRFVNECDKYWKLGVIWLEAVVHPQKGVGTTYVVTDFENACRDGRIFEDVIRKYGLPSKLYRHCTREMKERTIKKYSDDFFGNNNWIMALGMRADEPHRTKPKKDVFFPLKEIGAIKPFVRNWWSRQDFDLELSEEDGNCDDCFLKSLRKRLTRARKDPKSFEWWSSMENIYGSDKQPIFDVRNNLSVDDIVAMSKLDFVPYEENKSEDHKYDLEMDMEFDCLCSN